MPLSPILRPGLAAVLLSLLFALLQTVRAYDIYPEKRSFDDPKGETICKIELKDPNATFELSPMVENWDYAGSMPLKVKITNHLDRNETWQFDWMAYGKTIHTFAVSVPAQSTTEKIVLLPPLTAADRPFMPVTGDFVVRGVLGASTKSTLPLHPQYRSEHKEPPVLVDPALDKTKLVKHFSSPSYSENINRLHLDQWPADPMVYFIFNGIYLREKTWNALDTARKDALNQWVSAGGRLFILLDDASAQKPGVVNTGDGRTQYMKEDYKQLAEFIENNKGQLPLKSFYPPLPAYGEYMLDSPQWFVILVLLTFAVLVGPVSLFYWAPVGKRQKLFLLIPVISLSCSLVLALFIVITEGFGGRGQRVVRVILCPDSHMAVVKQSQESLTGILSNTTFPLNDKISCDMQRQASSPFTRSRRSHNSMDSYVFRQDNLAGGNYFSSRLEQSHQLLAFTPTRARITLSGDQESPVVLSTWPTPLTGFLYTDDHGVTWEAGQVAPGQKTPLVKHARKNDQEALPRKACFSAAAEPSELAPIPTHPDIVWQKNTIELSGPVTCEPYSQPAR